MTWLRVKLFVDIFSALWLAAQSVSAPLEKSVEKPRVVQSEAALDWNRYAEPACYVARYLQPE